MRHSSMQRPPMTSTAGWGRASTPQQGIVMVMTLILLTVMAVSTAVAVRLSLTTDMVGANLRARTLKRPQQILRGIRVQLRSEQHTPNMLSKLNHFRRMLALTRAWPQQLLQIFMVLLRIERDAPVPDLRGNKSTG